MKYVDDPINEMPVTLVGANDKPKMQRRESKIKDQQKPFSHRVSEDSAIIPMTSDLQKRVMTHEGSTFSMSKVELPS